MKKKHKMDPVCIKLLLITNKQLEMIKSDSQETHDIVVSIRDSLIRKNYLSTKQIGVIVKVMNRLEYVEKNS